MTKKTIVLSVILVILSALYAYYFTSWFRSETMQIVATIRPVKMNTPTNPRDPNATVVSPVSFSFDGKYRLTSVKVVAAADLATNKYPAPLWHLITDSSSAPTRSLVYGLAPKGMKPAVPRAQAQPLEPNVKYVLIVEAGDIKARTNFHTREVVQPATQ
jgi:hypothetical protein